MNERSSSMTSWQLRHARRYSIAIPAYFWWSSGDRPIRAAQGTTRDISIDGVLVAAAACPPEGARVRLEIRLPRFRGSGYGIKLQGEGRVVRVEPGEQAIPGEGTKGFAASVQFHPRRADPAEEPRGCVGENTEATYLN